MCFQSLTDVVVDSSGSRVINTTRNERNAGKICVAV
jgi:hypothetical protein